MKLADWPNMKDSSRKPLHKKLYSAAYPHMMEQKPMTLDNLANILGGGEIIDG